MLDVNIHIGHIWGMTHLQAYLARTARRQSDLALQVGATQATISRLASGTARPGLDLAFAIERATEGQVPAESWAEPPAAPDTGAAA